MSCLKEYKEICDTFIYEYYSNMENDIFNGNIHCMFDNKVKCTYNKEEFLDERELTIKLSDEGIEKVVYNIASYNSQPITDKMILLNVYGECIGVKSFSKYTDTKKFSETFVISKTKNNKYIVINHIFDIS